MTECTNVRTVPNRRHVQCLQYVFTVSTVRVGTVVRVRVPTVACQIASDCKLQNLDYLSRRRENRRYDEVKNMRRGDCRRGTTEGLRVCAVLWPFDFVALSKCSYLR